MEFLIIGRDGTDADAPARRLAVREAHLKLFQELYQKGVFVFASAILDDEGRMIGSMLVGEFPSRQALEEQWLQHEPYVVGNVWQSIEIKRAKVPPFIARPQPTDARTAQA